MRLNLHNPSEDQLVVYHICRVFYQKNLMGSIHKASNITTLRMFFVYGFHERLFL
jgi:hypothetical protein